MSTERSQRDEVRRILARAPWYLRLEARVIYAMLAMGIMCVCSSVVLVGIAVNDFEVFADQQEARSARLLDQSEQLMSALSNARGGDPAAVDEPFPGISRDDIGMVKLADGTSVTRGEATRSVTRAVAIWSGAALLISLFTGLVLARQTTRKLTHISDTMRRVSEGDEKSRAPVVGQDELAVLAIDLNGMLDQLEFARARVQYLQRVAAWQEMARRLAHEIKNPLTPISLAAQQLREKCSTSDDRSMRLLDTSVEIILDEVETLRRMVMSFSLFAAEPEFRRERVDLVRVVDEFLRAYAHAEVPVTPLVRVPHAYVEGDRQLLRQVLVNLVENAWNALTDAAVREGEIEISLDVDGTKASLTVSDNGPGLVGVTPAQIFEPYVTTRAEGMGLGLSIVKKIVLDHGGEVQASTGQGGGASVCVILPLHAGEGSAGAT